MKRCFLPIVVFVLSNVFALSQNVAFNAVVQGYGQLESVLGERWREIDSLVVSGPVNTADFKTMWKCAFEGRLTVLNLEHAQVEGRKIPDSALWDADRQFWETDVLVYLGIRRIMLPDDIEEIGANAFVHTKIERINIPSSIRKFGVCSFKDCHWLELDTLVIPEGVTMIPGQCFYQCSNIRSLRLPATVKTIGDYAFGETGIEECEMVAGLDSIGISAFQASGLGMVEIPETCTRLGIFCFAYNPELKEIRVPCGVTRLPDAFAYCCTGLKRADIPEGVTEIGNDAFNMCALDSVTFPASLKYIGSGACGRWDSVQKIYSCSPIPSGCGKDPFLGVRSDVPVYVPAGTAQLYRSANGWNHFTEFIETEGLPSAGIAPASGMLTGYGYKVVRSAGSIVVTVPERVNLPVVCRIYSFDGKIVRNMVLTETCTEIPFPGRQGIVRIGGYSCKVM